MNQTFETILKMENPLFLQTKTLGDILMWMSALIGLHEYKIDNKFINCS